MKPAKFSIHTNRELKDKSGKPMKFYSEKDYRSELARRGMEPYQPEKIKAYQPKKYKGVSEDAKKMMSCVTYDKNGRPNIGDRYIDKLKSMGMKPVSHQSMEHMAKQHGGHWDAAKIW